MTSRRHFLSQTLSLTSAFCLAPFANTFTLKAAGSSVGSLSRVDLTDLEQRARLAYDQREYLEAVSLYQELIKAVPSQVSYYDGLVRSLRPQQDAIAIVQVYKEGIRRNPRRPEFYVRLSKYYREIYGGNRRLARLLSEAESKDLLQVAMDNLSKAISKKRRPFLYLEMIECLQVRYRFQTSKPKAPRLRPIQVVEMLQNDVSPEANLARPYVQEWLRLHQTPSERAKLTVSTPAFLSARIKKRQKERTLYVEKEKRQRRKGLHYNQQCEACQRIHRQIQKSSAGDSASLVEVSRFLSEHPDQSHMVGYTRRKLRQSKQFSQLLELNQSWASVNTTSWSQMALAASQITQNSGVESQAESTLSNINEPLPQMHKATVAYYGAQARIALQQGRYTDARQQVMTAFEQHHLKGGSSLALLYLYARSYALEGNNQKAASLLRLRLDSQYETTISDPIMPYISSKYAVSERFFRFFHKELSLEDQFSIWNQIALNAHQSQNNSEFNEAEKQKQSLKQKIEQKNRG